MMFMMYYIKSNQNISEFKWYGISIKVTYGITQKIQKHNHILKCYMSQHMPCKAKRKENYANLESYHMD
jgi:hypothetical protein